MHLNIVTLTITHFYIFQSIVNSANVFNLPFNINQTTWSTNYGNNTPNVEYDFIVIGAGPAGCVLANRLTEIENFTVLLIEAGRPEIPMFTDIPMGAPLLQETDFNWGYATEPQERACLSMDEFRCNWPHGRGVGGSSIINYMIYTRGNRRDFDLWSEMGNIGWSYNDVLPYFKKSENAQFSDNSNGKIDKEYHGTMGPVNVEWIPFKSQIVDAFINSSTDAGYPNIDYNAFEQIGVSRIQQTTDNGWRLTAGKAYLEPILNRPNLHVVTHTRAIRLYFNALGTRAESVEILNNKKKFVVKSRKEIILSAGAFESPKLLMLSGVGPKDHLQELNITLVKDLPVGQTLYEHMSVFGPIFTIENESDGLISSEDVLKPDKIVEFFNGKGPFTSTGVESVLYMKTNNSISADPGYPDIELLQSFATISFDISQNTRRGVRLSAEAYESIFKPLEFRRSFQYLPMLLHPRSSGYMKLKSTNPFHHPLFYPNFFADSRDLDTLVDGIREAIRLTEQEPFRKLGAKLYEAKVPGCESYAFNTDDYWKCYAMHLSATLHHQVGTCKMGPKSDGKSVVSPKAIVHGFENLRVADVGIIPTPPSGHTTAFSYMIGERVASFIKSDWNVSNTDQTLERQKRHFDWQKVSESELSKINDSATETKHVLPVLSHEQTSSSITSPAQETKIELPPSVGDVGAILWGLRDNENTVITTKTATTPEIFVDEQTEPAIERIMNTAPSVSEDMIKTFKLKKDQYYGKGRAKPKYITMEFAKINSTEYQQDDRESVNSTAVVMGTHMEYSVSLAAR